MIDSAKIFIEGGKGGDGLVSFRREKYVPKGGPDGGDGGNGGSVILRATRELNTLSDHNRQKHYRAKNGQPGGKNRRTGATGQNLFIDVPIGTIVKDDSDKTIADLTAEGQEAVVARGGKGGRGNTHFSTPTHQTPREAESGTLGEKATLHLNLKLLADVGLVGLPNSGKSTLLATLTQAKPKIADYPFSTIEPMLGVAHYKKKSFVIADIPGLIEGAATGKGLGDQFLKHVERTKILVHLVPADSKDPQKDFEVINKELESFSKQLTQKPKIVVITQIDKANGKLSEEFTEGELKNAIRVSALTRENLDRLLDKIITYL